MAKVLSILAYAGDKQAARAAVVSDVAACTVRSVQHGDRAFCKDTADAIAGKTKPAEALRALLPVLADALRAVNDGTTGELAGMVAIRHANMVKGVDSAKDKDKPKARAGAAVAGAAVALVSAIVAAVTGSGLVVKGKASEHAEDFGAIVGKVFADTVDGLAEALKPVKVPKVAEDKGKGNEDDADIAPVVGAAVGAAVVVADGKPLADVLADMTDKEARTRARLARAVALAKGFRGERDALRVQVEALAAELSALKAAAVAVGKASRKSAKALAVA